MGGGQRRAQPFRFGKADIAIGFQFNPRPAFVHFTNAQGFPGERLGNAGGHSRLSNRYWSRQKSLEAAVTRAQKDYDDAGYAYRQTL